ncbi:ribonuclease domain-containing protein [Serratia ficaria]|uniref:ribonuclease domain-containing protein n=1 Tax=Serratia ficaria TaxID=61651 RepID=UPI00217BF4EF|nr:ribonuclease domain-containing protein [Serratia ficaria]MEE4484040.1 ribonuclease domain-containing protein [Serratia ficaria]CAI0815754.1 Ribonuclease precursor [Serratia ficaria]CAI1615609.1 Ribonuclease precursor [Serratia ficaria]CAI1838938.1 Ribonuclease precursor [Serratia ficaria]CAI2097356.1 Ribonuclease precursor [Serratia ficaria]
MNKRILVAIVIAVVIAGFSALRGTDRAIGVNAPAATQGQQQQQQGIDRLTQQQRVVSYLQQHQRLPDYYLTKKQAREQGWDPRDGNLCSVLPGRAIGGDRFSNREGRLPGARNRVWREADINYQCGRRGADRLLYSSDGLIFVTRDHYKNFIRVE